MEKKKATGFGSWPHALSRCGVFFPVSYYSWSSAWMSQESEREKEKGRVEAGGKTEIDRQKRKTEKLAGRGGGKGTDWLRYLSPLSDLTGV